MHYFLNVKCNVLSNVEESGVNYRIAIPSLVVKKKKNPVFCALDSSYYQDFYLSDLI